MGLLKGKNQRHTQVRKNWNIFEDFFFGKFLETFFPLFLHFLELYDDITWFSMV